MKRWHLLTSTGKIYRFLCHVNNEKGFLMGTDLALRLYSTLSMIHHLTETTSAEKNYPNKKSIAGLLDEKKRCRRGKHVGKSGLARFFNRYFPRIFA